MRESSWFLPLYSQYKSPKWNCGQRREVANLVRWSTDTPSFCAFKRKDKHVDQGEKQRETAYEHFTFFSRMLLNIPVEIPQQIISDSLL